jgi:hypothetical protein
LSSYSINENIGVYKEEGKIQIGVNKGMEERRGG